jgi:hypothetical protein
MTIIKADLLHLQTELISRIDAIQRQVEEIHAVVASSHKSEVPGIDEYRGALDAMAEGDMTPLKSYLKRGGMIPKAETIFPEMAGNGHKKTVCLTGEESRTATARCQYLVCRGGGTPLGPSRPKL